MAHKKFGSNRRFLNPTDKTCMGAVYWEVSVYYDRKKNQCSVEGDIGMNKDAQYHHVYHVKHLKAIDIMQAELNKFKQACLCAEEWCIKEGFKFSKAGKWGIGL